jgi:hypothetical protein
MVLHYGERSRFMLQRSIVSKLALPVTVSRCLSLWLNSNSVQSTRPEFYARQKEKRPHCPYRLRTRLGAIRNFCRRKVCVWRLSLFGFSMSFVIALNIKKRPVIVASRYMSRWLFLPAVFAFSPCRDLNQRRFQYSLILSTSLATFKIY